MEIYNPATGTSALVKLPANLASLPESAATVLLADGRVLIAGGTYDLDRSSSKATLIFDPASGALSDGPLMAEPREGATATPLADGRVLIAGGEDVEGGYGSGQSDAELIDPSQPLSQSTLLATRGSPITSTLLADGRVLLTEWGPNNSGEDCTTPPVSEVFDPTTETLTSVGPMSQPLAGSAAISIPDGRVLLFGSPDAICEVVDTVEAFDPDSGTFQVVATGFPEISGFSATLLDDGEILIAGGSDNNVYWNGMTARSWLLEP